MPSVTTPFSIIGDIKLNSSYEEHIDDLFHIAETKFDEVDKIYRKITEEFILKGIQAYDIYLQEIDDLFDGSCSPFDKYGFPDLIAYGELDFDNSERITTIYIDTYFRRIDKDSYERPHIIFDSATYTDKLRELPYIGNFIESATLKLGDPDINDGLLDDIAEKYDDEIYGDYIDSLIDKQKHSDL